MDRTIERPRVLITIATTILGGPGKGLLQFMKYGGMVLCEPLVCNFLVTSSQPWQFRDEFVMAGVPFTPLRQRCTYDPLLIVQAYRLVRKNRIQVLQSHGYKTHLLCLILKMLTGLPWIGFVHGWTDENWKIRLYRALDLVLLRFADRSVVVAESLRGQLVIAGIDESRIVTIRNAIEAVQTPVEAGAQVRHRYGVAEDDCLVGVVGRFSPEKGHTHFIEAMRRLVSERPRFRAMLVGEGQEEQTLRDQVARSGLEDHVIFTGYQKDVSPFFRAFSLLVLPSLSEGMPNAALEAMAFGTPVVATRVGGVPEVVIDGVTGILVEAADPGALADAMKSLIDDAGRAISYGKAGMARVRSDFDPHVRANKIIALYHELQQKRPAPRHHCP